MEAGSLCLAGAAHGHVARGRRAARQSGRRSHAAGGGPQLGRPQAPHLLVRVEVNQHPARRVPWPDHGPLLPVPQLQLLGSVEALLHAAGAFGAPPGAHAVAAAQPARQPLLHHLRERAGGTQRAGPDVPFAAALVVKADGELALGLARPNDDARLAEPHLLAPAQRVQVRDEAPDAVSPGVPTRQLRGPRRVVRGGGAQVPQR
mmetsp:Transcript_10186/g.27163  ORF Transcript_10186/g.27163 Transcript_10186/m.27163 type:complete len:204 (+) Transcript_10186:223-834(+)